MTDIPSRTYAGKLALQQRVLPTYRVPFFEALALACQGGFSLFAGEPRKVEAIQTANSLQHGEFYQAHNRHMLGGPFYLCNQTNILEWLDSSQPDVLIVEANSRYPSTRRAIRWMRARNRPVLGWGLGAPPLSSPLASIRQGQRRRFLHSLDGVIAYSQRGADEYRAMGLAAERVFVAHNAATPKPTIPPPARPANFERATLLFVGRLQERKRLDMLFRACATFPDEKQPRLLVVGDGPARGTFEEQAQHLYPQTEFLGAVHGAELEPIYTRADLFVLPGTGGLAVQQAMASGLPVIVARGDGTQEDLVRQENGWLVQPDDQDSLNIALREALSDPARLRRMGAESFRITTEEINLEQMVVSFIKALESVSQRRGG